MSAKEFLEQYIDINAEIDQLAEKLSELSTKRYEYGVSGVEGSSKEIPYAKHNILVAGYERSERVQAQIDKLGKTYQQKLEALYEGRVEAENMLSNISDAKARTIIRYRYIDGMEWQKIADKLNEKKACIDGTGNTEDSVRKYSERYLEKVS